MTGKTDYTLLARRRLFEQLFAIARHPVAEALLARTLRPYNPAMAREAGERLLTRPYRVVAFTAHPDDLEFFAAGVLRRLALAGSEVYAVVLSDGEKRGNRYDLGGVRRQEQLRAARVQGYTDVEFCGLPDFGLPEDPRLERAISSAWERYQPELVLAFDPKELVAGFANRDHKALGRAVADLARHKVGTGVQVLFYGTRHPNVVVDVEPVLEDRVKAVLCHESQLLYMSRSGYAEAARFYNRLYGAGVGLRYAEGLYRLI